MSTPFFKADPRAWAIAAEILPKPWPRELVEMDLAWWQDQVAVGKQTRIPGHVTMQARWGWSERAARAALRALSVPPPSRERTAAVPPPSRAETDGGQQSAKSVPPPSRERTAAVPSASNTRGSPEPRTPEHQTPEISTESPRCACGRPLGRKAVDGVCAACLDRRAAGVEAAIPDPDAVLASLPPPTPELDAAVQRMKANAALPSEVWAAQVAATIEPEHPEERTRKVEPEARPRKSARPKVAKPLTDRQALIAGWSTAYEAATGSKYAWAFAGPDAREVRAWVELVAGGVEVGLLCAAMQAFCQGWKAGQVFGAASPFPRRFNAEANHWLHVAQHGPVLSPKERAAQEAAQRQADEVEELMVRSLRRQGVPLSTRPDLAAAVARVDAQDLAAAPPRPTLTLVGA